MANIGDIDFNKIMRPAYISLEMIFREKDEKLFEIAFDANKKVYIKNCMLSILRINFKYIALHNLFLVALKYKAEEFLAATLVKNNKFHEHYLNDESLNLLINFDFRPQEKQKIVEAFYKAGRSIPIDLSDSIFKK